MNEVQYVYAVIPARYVCLYHKLLVLLADYGVEMLNDCQATCKGSNKTVVTCFNMFNAGVAAYQLGETKKAEIIMKYINSQVNMIYSSRGRCASHGEFKLAATEDGTKTAYISCNGDTASFRIEDTPDVKCIKETGIMDATLTNEDFGIE